MPSNFPVTYSTLAAGSLGDLISRRYAFQKVSAWINGLGYFEVVGQDTFKRIRLRSGQITHGLINQSLGKNLPVSCSKFRMRRDAQNIYTLVVFPASAILYSPTSNHSEAQGTGKMRCDCYVFIVTGIWSNTFSRIRIWLGKIGMTSWTNLYRNSGGFWWSWISDDNTIAHQP